MLIPPKNVERLHAATLLVYKDNDSCIWLFLQYMLRRYHIVVPMILERLGWNAYDECRTDQERVVDGKIGANDLSDETDALQYDRWYPQKVVLSLDSVGEPIVMRHRSDQAYHRTASLMSDLNCRSGPEASYYCHDIVGQYVL